MSVQLVPGGHSFYERAGEIDAFVLDVGYHNGPGCDRCFDSWCEHCDDSYKTAMCPVAADRSVSRPVPDILDTDGPLPTEIPDQE